MFDVVGLALDKDELKGCLAVENLQISVAFEEIIRVLTYPCKAVNTKLTRTAGQQSRFSRFTINHVKLQPRMTGETFVYEEDQERHCFMHIIILMISSPFLDSHNVFFFPRECSS